MRGAGRKRGAPLSKMYQKRKGLALTGEILEKIYAIDIKMFSSFGDGEGSEKNPPENGGSKPECC
jgi:hypothetical protein